MPFLFETYNLQMYAGEEPQKMTRTILVSCRDDVPTVKHYIEQVERLMNELGERKVKLWKLNDKEKQWETKFNQERQARIEVENKVVELQNNLWTNIDYFG